MSRFALTDVQADAILEMKLRRLTGLERDTVESELKELLAAIEEYKSILASEEKIYDIIKKELLEIKEKYADERRTHIDMTAIDYIEDESLIPEENSIITLTNKNYIKRLSTDTYRTQNRGGMGIKGITTNTEDFVEKILTVSTHDYILFFSNKGKVYRMKGYEIPEFSRTAKGLPIVNLLPLEKEETIKEIIKIEKESKYKCLIFATKNGVVKRTLIEEFDNIRQNGKIAIKLKDNDELIAVSKTDGSNQVLMCSYKGRMVRYNESEIRLMGRTASGVRGINLKSDDRCISMETSLFGQEILVVTEKGYGKKTNIEEYRETKRGSKGVKALNVTEKNGNVIGFKLVTNDKDLIITTNLGVVIRLDINKISNLGRVTQGVRLINLKENNFVSSISVVEKEENEDMLKDSDTNEETATDKKEE